MSLTTSIYLFPFGCAVNTTPVAVAPNTYEAVAAKVAQYAPYEQHEVTENCDVVEQSDVRELIAQLATFVNNEDDATFATNAHAAVLELHEYNDKVAVFASIERVEQSEL